jgi:hypothetical protein
MEIHISRYYELLPKEIWDKILCFLKVVDIINFSSTKREFQSTYNIPQWWKKYYDVSKFGIFPNLECFKPLFLAEKIINRPICALMHLEDAKAIDEVTITSKGTPTKRSMRVVSPYDFIHLYVTNDYSCLIGKSIVIYKKNGQIKMRNLINGEHYNILINNKTLIRDIVVEGQCLIEQIEQYIRPDVEDFY